MIANKSLFMESVRAECFQLLQSEHEEMTVFNFEKLFSAPPEESCLLTAGCEDDRGQLWEWRVWMNVCFPPCVIHTDDKFGDFYFTKNYMVSVAMADTPEGKTRFDTLRKSNPV